ncbi:MAG: hypothetical protein J3K34DRAFT_416602, partial [Monoraphidium minutum]
MWGLELLSAPPCLAPPVRPVVMRIGHMTPSHTNRRPIPPPSPSAHVIHVRAHTHTHTHAHTHAHTHTHTHTMSWAQGDQARAQCSAPRPGRVPGRAPGRRHLPLRGRGGVCVGGFMPKRIGSHGSRARRIAAPCVTRTPGGAALADTFDFAIDAPEAAEGRAAQTTRLVGSRPPPPRAGPAL